MTANSPLLRFLPIAYILGLALLSCLLYFNGLDGQAIKISSWLAGGLALLVFERLLTRLAQGSRPDSRWAFALLGLGLSPAFLRAGLTSASDMLGLALMLASLFFGLRAFEKRRHRYAVWAAAIGVGGAVLATCFWLKTGPTGIPLGLDLLHDWSLGNFFRSGFNNGASLLRYPLPNIFFILFPMAHPSFCLCLPGLFFLSKKTDLALPSKKLLLACIAACLFLLGGLPHQNLLHLLPAYALLLLLFFPAWDRFYCYGFIFFKRLTTGLLVAAIFVQVFFCAKMLALLCAG